MTSPRIAGSLLIVFCAGFGQSAFAKDVDTSTAISMSSKPSTRKPPAKYNRLIHEKSPYLLQHAHNPIWWYSWGDEALAAAKRENKPIFLSIGYSTCYWCHFMEKDSFEKEDVAAVLNEHFISIKVDREERPDVDNIYMTALVSMTGSGGWPMSMFLTPEGQPFFGASTIQHDRFIGILGQIAAVWKNESAKIRESGERVTSALRQYLNPAGGRVSVSDAPSAASPASARRDIGEEALISFYNTAESQFDKTYGGFGGGNKFPRPHVFMALLRYHRRAGDPQALKIVAETLKAMARGGIHDVLVGGFHRYSVDGKWEVPHFEKMLYDNAGLIVAYLEAYQVTRDPEFARIARKTMDWVLAEMTHPAGGFYSAQDAGDFGEEGDYYAWRYDEAQQILTPEEFEHVRKFFRLTPEGNFDHNRNVIHVPADVSFPGPAADTLYAAAHGKLLAIRAKRERPRLDDKVLVDWNGLMIAAMARGYQVLGDEKYLRAAQRAAGFIRKNVTKKDGRLHRRWREGEASNRAVVNDYAFLIHGLIELYQSDFDPRWFEWAIQLQELQDKDFWDEQNGGYFFDDAKDATLLSRSKEYDDMAMPSGNSIAALNLLRLADFTYDDKYKKRADDVIRSAAGQVARSPFAYAQTLVALDYALDRSKEIAIAGKLDDARTRKIVRALRSKFLPNKVVAVSDGRKPAATLILLDGKTPTRGDPTAYVCEEGVCQLPTTDAATVLKQAETHVPIKK